MLKPLMRLSLILALALPFTPTQARADEDVFKVLGGLMVLYAVGKAIEDHKEAPRQYVHKPKPPKVHTRKVLPEKCFRQFRRLDGGIASGFAARCMQRNVERAGALPSRCLRQVETTRGTRNLFKPRCMRKQGWVRLSHNRR